MVGSAWGTIHTILFTLRNPLIAGGVVLGGVLLGFGGWQAAKRFGWHRVPSVAAGISLGVVFGATFSRTLPAWAKKPGREFCHVNGFSATGGNEMSNVLLFVPLVFFAVLAVRRVLVVLGSAIALSAAIELAQTLTGRGLCETQDFLDNSVESLVAAVAAAAAVALSRRYSR